VGAAEADVISNPEPSDSESCIFDCGDANDDTMMPVEMNVDAAGKFHARLDHVNQAVRKTGVAHERCYAEWYQTVYKSPFTMSD
jgi:hypothetical protein